MIPAPTPSGYAWRESPVPRQRPAQVVTPFRPSNRKPFSKQKAELHNASGSPLKINEISEFQGHPFFHDYGDAPPLADHMFAYKAGCTLSDSAIRLLRLKSWLEICINDRKYEADAYITECRLREQADFIIGWCA